MKRCLFAIFLLITLSLTALAHKPSDSYLSIKVEEARVTGQWDIAIRDLHHAIGLDANGDGNVTWGELKAAKSKIEDYAFKRLHIAASNRDGK